MALTGFDFRISTRGASPMRPSIDLNKHAFDLNEMPSVGGAPTAADAHGFAVADLGAYDAAAMNMWPPKTGGWLELFRNMFGQEHLNGCKDYFLGIPQVASRGSDRTFDRNWESRKRSRVSDQSLHRAPQQHKRSRTSEQTPYRMFEQPRTTKTFQTAFNGIIPKQELNRSFCQQASPQYFMQENHRGMLHGIPAQELSSSRCQQASQHCFLQENHRTIEHSLQIRDQRNGDIIGRGNIPEPIRQDELQSFSADDHEPFTQIIASPDWLPEGWITELKTRKTGSTAGTKDKYYKDPISGHRFRSKNEVMSFLQTGRMSRYKPKAKTLEGSQFLPSSKESSAIPNSIQLHPSKLVEPSMHQSILPPGPSTSSLKNSNSSVLPNVPDCVSNWIPEVSTWQKKSVPNLVLEKLAVKENALLLGGMLASQDLARFLEVRTPVEGLCKVTQSKLGPTIKMEREEDMSILECRSRQTFHEPVGRVHQSKSQILGDSPLELPFEHNFSRVKEVNKKDIQNVQGVFIDSSLQKSEAQMLHSRHEFDARILQNKDVLPLCETKPMVNTSRVNHVSSPCKRFGEMHPGKWLLNKTSSERKVVKLTPRQGKELLVLLGRKLCWQFLGSAGKTILPHCKNHDKVP